MSNELHSAQNAEELRGMYVTLRKQIGTQPRVAYLLALDTSTIARRETGAVSVTWEQYFALQFLRIAGYKRRPKAHLGAKEA